jgi:uncharacterized membrane protein
VTSRGRSVPAGDTGGRSGSAEPRWPAALAVVAALGLQLALPNRYAPLGTRWLLPALEAALLTMLLVASPYRDTAESRELRTASIVLIGLVNAGNVYSLARLVDELVGTPAGHRTGFTGHQLFLNALVIWLTLILIFALWYWEFDRGGPACRATGVARQPDLLFPQNTAPASGFADWSPTFVDYLYVAFTNATAFSPTDTMPLSRWTKMVFLVQALASFLTVALVAARAVNILG